MALFKSKEQKTEDALFKLVAKCSDEAKERLKLIYEQLEEGARGEKKCSDPFVAEFYEIYKLIEPMAAGIGFGQTAQTLPLALSRSSRFWEGCCYYIFLNLLISELRQKRLKYLSKSELDDLEENDMVHPYIDGWCGFTSTNVEAIQRYVYGTDFVPIRYLFEKDIRLIH